MSLREQYERFLASPNPLALSDTATLHYVTTLKSFTQPGPIVKHLETQNKNVVRKKSEKTISSVEGQSAIALEVETTLEFISSGGTYLPGLDNFIIDHVATLPVTHFVNFDRDGKISQIRQSWDQGSLLRQAEVIGARGKNWPVFDGKDQIKLIARSSSSAAAVAPTTPPRGRGDDNKQLVDRSFSPSKKYIKDPHASLDLFDPSRGDENRRSAEPNAVPPRASAKPPPREYSELFAAGHEDLQPSPGGSPNKAIYENVVAPKGAGARKLESSNLFSDDQTYQKEKKIYKTNPARYNHFDIGDHDEHDPMQYRAGDAEKSSKPVPVLGKSHKSSERSQSQWGFNDYTTPEKAVQKVRDSDAVHFSIGDQNGEEQGVRQKGAGGVKPRKDAETHFELQDSGTPIDRPAAQPRPRKDAVTHFDMRDDLTPAPRRIIGRTKAAAGLYENNIIESDEDDSDVSRKAPLSNITNNAGRRNNDVHWTNNDDAPPNGGSDGLRKPTGVNQSRSAKNLESHWDTYDASPIEAKKPLVSNQRKGMETHWSMGDGGHEATKAGGVNGRQQEKSFWDF